MRPLFSAAPCSSPLPPRPRDRKNASQTPFLPISVAGNAFVVPDNKACFACHGSYKDLAEKTAKLEEPNPHKSHHYGEGIACTSCHSEHGQSKVYCNECHEFKYTIR